MIFSINLPLLDAALATVALATVALFSETDLLVFCSDVAHCKFSGISLTFFLYKLRMAKFSTAY